MMMTAEQHIATMRSTLDCHDRNHPKRDAYQSWDAYRQACERHDIEAGRICEIIAAAQKRAATEAAS